MRFVRTVLSVLLTASLLLTPGAWPAHPAPPGRAPEPAAAAQQRAAAAQATPYFTEPAVAPDREEIAFVSGGDIWTAPLGGGEAHLLIAHATSSARPMYSPDGKHLAFVSNRTGNGNIYVYTFSSGETRRLTFDDSAEMLSGWSRDGRWIYFHSNALDIAGMQDVFRVPREGGTPTAVTADRYLSEFFGAPSPDGRALAFTARGTASGQWWRKGHSHIDTSEIWLRREGGGYERLVEGGAKNLWPMWAPDGRTLYFMSDRSGAENIWMHRLGGETRQVTRFRDGRVLWPSISWDGRTIVFERDFAIWRLDTASGEARRIPLTRRAAPPAPTVERLTLNNQFSSLALSPDGRKVAFLARGDVFAAGARDGGIAVRVTSTPAPEYHAAWSPDSRKLVYVSTRDGAGKLFLYDFTTETETQLTRGPGEDHAPLFSPDGDSIAFLRDGREVRVLEVKTGQDRRVAAAGMRRPPFGAAAPVAWSPDSKWLAFLSTGEKSFTNVHVVSAAGGEARPVSFVPNAFANTLSWAPDGSFLLFDTGQRTEPRQLARVDLVPRTPRFHEDQFRELFREEPRAPRGAAGEGQRPQPPSKAEPRPVEIRFEDIRRRASFIPVGVDLGYQTLSPDGKTVLVIGSAAGQTNLYTYSLDELARGPVVARQLTSTPGFKTDAQFTPDGREVFFLQQGRIQIVNVENRQMRALEVTAELSVDFDLEKMEVFRQAWTWQRDHFYDEKFHGADWEAIRRAWTPLIAGARTRDEVRRLLGLMVGELNASHLGVTGPTGSAASNNGRLGLRFDPAEYESSGRLRVSEVIALGPAAIAGIGEGEYLRAVDGARIAAGVNLDELLAHKTGRRTVLSISAAADGSGARDVAVMPVSVGAEKNLLYRHWVESRRAYVERASNGRLGYVHMFNMSAQALEQLFIDLDAETHGREGVVVDIRNNSGGFVNAYALDVFSRRPYLLMSIRGLTTRAPARSVLGQRALELPTILVTNQHSLSDAEDFTEGYRAMKLGKVVGEPTAGWIIYTSNLQLMDGSTLRIPFMRVETAEGQPMELVPRPVDIPVQRPVGESYTPRDVQLDTAVAELLKQIGRR